MTPRSSCVSLVALALAACEPSDRSVERGAKLYQRYCALCHGAKGEGYAADHANALSNQEFLKTASDELLVTAIERGRPGTSMSAWERARGGPLSRGQVSDVAAHVRSWQSDRSVDVDSVTVDGQASRGSALYAVKCATCHGDQGQGGLYLSLGNPEFLAVVSDGYLRRAVTVGRPGTKMGPYADSIPAQGIDDLVALIRSWQKPPGGEPAVLPTEFDDPVVNPDGPEPDFGPGRFVSVDVVAGALDAGAAMVLLDARPPADYVREHIAGAVSVPFYAVGDYLGRLPRDRWIVAYCACPHAESGAAADELEAHGYEKVRVLDEGFLVWRERGHPVRSGPDP